MLVAHNLAWYFPDSSGGTEVYVDGLVSALRERGINGSVIAATSNDTGATYRHNQVQVHRYPVPHDHGREVIRGTIAHEGFEKFERVLGKLRPDIFHLHNWTPDAGLHHLRYAKSIGLPTVLTMHTPGFVCMRGTMMRNDDQVCDGVLETKKCTECLAQARGVSEIVARAISRIPDQVSRFAMQHINWRSAGTAIALSSLVDMHKEQFLEAGELADRIVVLSEWQHKTLTMNYGEENKLVLCKHGVSIEFDDMDKEDINDSVPIRVGMIGRADPVKGMHTALMGFKKLEPDTPIQLFVHAMMNEQSNTEYLKRLKYIAGGDRRIHFGRPIRREELPGKLKMFNLLLVPSEWLETGPLVVLEALASKVPVFGSKLGGIQEYVQDGVNGRLIEPSDESAWGDALADLEAAPEMLAFYRKNIKKMRTMGDVASETRSMYEDLCR